MPVQFQRVRRLNATSNNGQMMEHLSSGYDGLRRKVSNSDFSAVHCSGEIMSAADVSQRALVHQVQQNFAPNAMLVLH